MKAQFSLLRDNRFAPLFVTQFLGAFNDNLMKSMIVTLVAYGVWDMFGMEPSVFLALAGALFILPFIVLCPIAGELASRYDKAQMIKWIKVAEVFIVVAAAISFYFELIGLAFFVLFALGAQSAFFTPCKFAILPQLLKKDELIGANAVVATGTYVAILAGTILGTLLALRPIGLEAGSAVLFVCAIAGYLSSLQILKGEGSGHIASSVLRFVGDSYAQITRAVKAVRFGQASVFWAVMGISWFYFVAAVIHTQLPNYASQTLGVNSDVLTIFMIIFSMGIAVGGLLNNSLLKSEISARFVPYAAVGIAFFATELYFAAKGFAPAEILLAPGEFFTSFAGMRVAFDLAMLSVCGGLYVVPLRAVIQGRASKNDVTRIVAASGVFDATFMLISSLLSAALLAAGMSVAMLFVWCAIATAFLAVWAMKTGLLRRI